MPFADLAEYIDQTFSAFSWGQSHERLDSAIQVLYEQTKAKARERSRVRYDLKRHDPTWVEHKRNLRREWALKNPFHWRKYEVYHREWERSRYQSDPEYRARKLARARKRNKERYHNDPAYREKVLAQSAKARQKKREDSTTGSNVS